MQFTPAIVFSKRDFLFGSWQNILLIIRPIYAKAFVAKEANKLSMQFKISIRFHRAEVTYFKINIICLRQADLASRLYGKEFTFDKSSSIKQTIYQKLLNSNGNTFCFILHICDLLREKGPTAVKRRFKTQLTAFALYMLCNIFTSTS